MTQTPPSFERLSRLAARILLAVGMLVVASTPFRDTVAVPFSVLRLSNLSVVLIGLSWVVLGSWLLYRPRPWGVSLLLFIVVLNAAFVLTSHPPRRGEREFHLFLPWAKGRVWTAENQYSDPSTRSDPELGFSGRPNVAADQVHPEFRVTYHHNADGYRVMPTPQGPGPHPEIIFLGCSMTYGIGVADDETYPWLLAEKAWPRYRVINTSISGYGPNHACVIIERMLAEGRRPALVFYAYFDGHLQRVHLRKSWHEKTRARFPRFDTNGKYLGLWEPKGLIDAGDADLNRTEQEISRAVIVRMKESCDKADVPFVVLRIFDTDSRSDEIFDIPGLKVLRIDDACVSTFYRDGHPTKLSHQRYARALAGNEKIAEWAGRADLHQPEAFPNPLPGERDFHLRRFSYAGSYLNAPVNADVVADEKSARVTSIHVDPAHREQMALSRLIPQLDADRQGVIQFDVRADEPRDLEYAIHSPGTNQRIERFTGRLSVDPKQQTKTIRLPSGLAFPEAELEILFGRSSVPFELVDFSFRAEAPIPFGIMNLPTHESDSQMLTDPGRPGWVRVEQLNFIEPAWWHVQLTHPVGPVSAGTEYRVTARCRADEPKPLLVVLVDGLKETDYRVLSPFVSADLSTDWQELELRISPNRSSDGAWVVFQLGGNRSPIELEELKVEPIGTGRTD